MQIRTKRKYVVFINIGLAMLAALWISNYYRLAVVSGRSMEPVLTQGDIVLVEMGRTAQHKDIVVVDSHMLHKRIIKRVIAVEGDAILISDGKIYINEELVKEDYIKEQCDLEDAFFVVPPQNVYVLGDNRNYSRDSRMIGFIPEDEVMGIVKYPEMKGR